MKQKEKKLDFQQFKTVRYFRDSIYNGKINIKEAEKKQNNRFENIVSFNKSGPKSKKDKENKQTTLDNINALYEGRELILNTFRSGTFPMKEKQGKGLKIITPKEILQRLLIAIAQVKAGNTSENLSNEIRQIIYSLFRAKEITKKVYRNIMNSIKVLYKNEYYICEF